MSAGRFEYNDIKFDFVRPWNAYQVVPNNFQSVQSALSGVTEVLELYNQHTIKVNRTYLSGSELDQLMAWYEYVRDGSSFKFYRDRDLVLYLPFEKSLINRVDGNVGTFTRSGNAKYLDRSTGEVESVTTDNPRYPAGNFGDGLLIENATSNLLDATEDFSDVLWTATNISVTADQMIAPDGTATADKLNATAAGNMNYSTTTAITTSSGTFSVWIRSVSATQEFDLSIGSSSAGQLEAETYTATTEWQRFTVSHKTSGSVAGNWYVKIHLDSVGQTVYAWGAQLETYKHETGYCKDAGGRVVEAVYFDLPSHFNSRNWSLSFWYKAPWAESDAYDRRFFNLADTTSSSCYFRLSANNTFRFVHAHYVGGGTIDASWPGSYGLTADTWTNIAITFDSTINSGLKIYLDGIASYNSLVYQCVPKVTNRLYLGAATNQTEYANAEFDDVLMVNGTLSAGEIKAIANSGRALGVERSYYPAVRLINPSFEPVRKIGLDRWDFEAEFEEVIS